MPKQITSSEFEVLIEIAGRFPDEVSLDDIGRDLGGDLPRPPHVAAPAGEVVEDGRLSRGAGPRQPLPGSAKRWRGRSVLGRHTDRRRARTSPAATSGRSAETFSGHVGRQGAHTDRRRAGTSPAATSGRSAETFS